MSKIKIAFQGEKGAYSHIACEEIYEGAEIKNCATFEETFKMAFEDENFKAIIPIENSLAGRVADIHYLLPKYKLQIYDEHFYMFSANSIASILDKFNLELVNAERIPTHGGSMRYYVKKTKSTKISKKLKQILMYEKKIQITKIQTIKKFVANCINSKKRIIKIMKMIKKKR